MSDSNASEAKPYHHGDLRRALVEAARQLVETEGPTAMSLRAVARQAGVSPAAPYHHFKDKGELLGAVATEGWAMLGGEVLNALQTAPEDDKPTLMLLAYVRFARAHPALYRVMFDAAQNAESMPMLAETAEGGHYPDVRAISRAAAAGGGVETELDMAATWSAAHGLAQMAGFKQFEHLKCDLGGEVAFLEAVLRRVVRRVTS
jgi:AcrR family transcriptional regulator